MSHLQGAHIFSAKINIEVQWASEAVIAAIERNGGVITCAYYDVRSLTIMRNPMTFFEQGNSMKNYYKSYVTRYSPDQYFVFIATFF